jgi:hypothetical protein
MIKVSDIKALPKYNFLWISACKRNVIKPCPNRPSFSCEIEWFAFQQFFIKISPLQKLLSSIKTKSFHRNGCIVFLCFCVSPQNTFNMNGKANIKAIRLIVHDWLGKSNINY